jgi:nitroreductase
MDVFEAVRTRKSIRGFKNDPVPKEILAEILEISTRAPSSDNSQPWEIFVLTGESLDSIRKENLEAFEEEMNSPREGSSTGYQPVYRKRQIKLAVQLYQLMDIAREDREKRLDWMKRGFRFFDAPVGIILTADESLDNETAASDNGGLAQTICLVALKNGLGTCIIQQGISYPAVIRRNAGIPESKRLCLAIALGYPDWEFPANRIESDREPLDVNTTWKGFD